MLKIFFHIENHSESEKVLKLKKNSKKKILNDFLNVSDSVGTHPEGFF